MNGTILGMTRREIDRKLDEIVDFSGVEKYCEIPVKFDLFAVLNHPKHKKVSFL